MTRTIPATDAADSTDIVTFWVSGDGQGSLDMSGMTAADALAELLAQCSDADDAAGVMAGCFDLAE